jgi:hypothetical protein
LTNAASTMGPRFLLGEVGEEEGGCEARARQGMESSLGLIGNSKKRGEWVELKFMTRVDRPKDDCLGNRAEGIIESRATEVDIAASWLALHHESGVFMKVFWVVPLLLVHAFGQSATAPDPASPAPTVTVSRADSVPHYEPVTGTGRVKWFVVTTAGPLSLLAGGPISAGWDTLLNKPKEYGPHWEGFGERYGMGLTGLSSENAMEATVGGWWGEDPRYFPSPKRGFGPRAST